MSTIHLVMQGKGGVGKSLLAFVDTGVDRSAVSYTLCRELDHVFEAGWPPSIASGIGKGKMRTFSHGVKITVLATPITGKAPNVADAVFSPIEMKLGFVEQKLPFALLGQADFPQLFEYRQIRSDCSFSLRRLWETQGY
ncbi:MAG: hypothetical protein LBU64_08965 [Planctomycetota bacterium]|jgi:hypothetical protein|nr:hypothetical protein [Planctomycetota bacterium]